MMLRRLASLATLLALSSSVGLGLVSGCSSDAASEDEAAGGQGGASSDIRQVSSAIGVEGGKLGLTEASLTVPAGALKTKTQISLSVLDSKAALPSAPKGTSISSSAVAFLPHGTNFETPVTCTLTVPSSSSSQKKAVFKLDNESDTSWSVVSGATVSGNQVSFQTKTFSIYAAFDDPEGLYADSVCGNGKLEAGEVCDDNNTLNDDDCSADCSKRTTCGNGQVDADNGETCDPGKTCEGTTACTSDSDCGDNLKCGLYASVTCETTCQEAICGDGIVNKRREESCDPGTVGGDSATCTSSCRESACGDGYKNVAAGEVCDDGNLVNGDGCSADCKSTEICGNGIVDAATQEVCDDGVNNGQEGYCNGTCTDQVQK